MKFLIDAHLPPGLRAVFREAGHDAIHTLDLPERNASRDGILNQVSVTEERVVVSKDTDFYHSHLLHGRPWKLVLVRTGESGSAGDEGDVRDPLAIDPAALEECTLVELEQQRISIVA